MVRSDLEILGRLAVKKPFYLHTGGAPPGECPKRVDEQWWNDTWKKLQDIHTVSDLRTFLRGQAIVIRKNWNRALDYFSENPYDDWKERIRLGYRGRLSEDRVVPERMLLGTILWFEKYMELTGHDRMNARIHHTDVSAEEMFKAFSRLLRWRFTETSRTDCERIGYGALPKRPPITRVCRH